MLYTNAVSRFGSHIGTNADKRESRPKEYDAYQRGTQASVYSAQCSIPLVRSFDVCTCCQHETELVNGYCDICRSMGANERECLNPRLINRRSATGRKNSKNSMWRVSRI
jgi:hypothetical protein